MRRLISLITFMCFVIVAFSQNQPSIDFTIRNLGLNVEGHFDKFSVSTTFNTQKELTNLSSEITVNSIETGIDSRDAHLLKEDYFHIKNHPKITLKSIIITSEDNNTYLVKAELTIKGKTKTINIPVTVKKELNEYKITSSFEINRRDFKVGGSSFVMSNTVKINVVHYQKS